MDLKNQFDLKLKAEAKKYQEKIISEVSEGKRSSSYTALRKLGVGGQDVGKIFVPSLAMLIVTLHPNNQLMPLLIISPLFLKSLILSVLIIYRQIFVKC